MKKTWYDVIGDRDGDCLIFKTRYGLVRIERTVDHRGQLFTVNGSVEGLFLNLEHAIEAAMNELAVRTQEQKG